MKGVLAFLAAVIIASAAAGCGTTEFLPERTEIDKLLMIRAVGIDKGIKAAENIRVTALGKESEAGQGGGAGGQSQKEKALVLCNEAPTILEAEREFQTYSDRKMFWGHTEYVLISEDAARENIGRYIDFLIRDHEMRVNSKIYIIRGSTAEEFIEKSSTGEYFMPDRLRAIGENSKLLSGARELEMLEFMQWLNNKYSSAIAPVLYLRKAENGKNEEVNQAMEIEIGGYAAFRNLKLITFLDKEETRGENFLLNRVLTGVIEVKDKSGDMVGLDIISSSARIDIAFDAGELQGMIVKVKLISNVDEVHSTNNIFTEENLNYLSTEQSAIVKKEIEKVIKTAKENKIDFVDMADEFSKKHPVLWQKYKDKWEDIFPALPVTVEVESRIHRTYDIREPNGYTREEWK